ncbi:MerR family transcriptional regulator [Deinococcus roseus]|uniref:MerR family transcriptional regulator n=1 Tax=Deinococcus roseus TaxID=392414 RepID=A0ABQ2DEP1_9DEIO|nr:MerR family transcriptional regulator [Deinococcus roseus]GGJ55462.1 MerR family transcriptional regulator [Deinococcus roseus]
MFKVGEFSRIAQVSTRLLRHYDHIGLFTPEHQDPHTGYRHYTASQLPTLHRILALRDLGLSLDQIDRVMQQQLDVQEIRGMLLLKKQQLEQSIQEEIQKLQRVESRLRQVEKEGTFETESVVLRSFPEQRLLSYRQVFPTRPDGLQAMWKLANSLPAGGKPSQGAFTVVFHTMDIADENLDVELGFLLPEGQQGLSFPTDLSLQESTIEAHGTVATLYRHGWHDQNLDCMFSLAQWMEVHGYRFAGHLREVYIKPPLQGRETESVAELQWPVEKIHPPILPLN